MTQPFAGKDIDREAAASVIGDDLWSRAPARPQIEAWFAIHANDIAGQMMAAIQPYLRADVPVAETRRSVGGHVGTIVSATLTLPSMPLHIRGIGKDIAQVCDGHAMALAGITRALRRQVLDSMPPEMALSIGVPFEYILTEIAWGYAVTGDEIERERRESPPHASLSTFHFDADWLIATADQCPIAVAIYDVSLGRLIAGNAALVKMFGYTHREFDRIPDSELMGSESPDADGDVFIQLAAGVISHVRRISAFRHKDGHMVWFEMVAWLVRNAEGVPSRIAYTYTPQGDLLGVGEHWQRADARFRHLSQLSPDPILLVHPEGHILYASPAIAATLGIESEEARGMAFEDLVLEDDLPQIGHLFAGGIEQARAQVRQRARLHRRDGEWRWFELSSVNMLDVPNLGAFAVQARDISEQIAVEAILSRQALVDELTGLPNRRAVTEYIDAALEREAADGAGQHLCVMFLDLNRFKRINDRLGHAAGDVVLAEIGRRLRVELRTHAFVARFGGDEFIACLEQTSPERAMRAAQRLIRHVAEPFEIDGQLQTVSAEVGLAMSSPDLCDAASLVHAADSALYHAKALRDGKPVVYTPSHGQSGHDAHVRIPGK